MSNESLALLVVLTLILILPWLAALSLRVWTLRSSPPPSSSHPNLPQPVPQEPPPSPWTDPARFLRDREVLAVRREMSLHPQPQPVSVETRSGPPLPELAGPTLYWTTSLSLPADVVMEAQAGNLVAVLTLGTLTAHSLAFYRSGGRSGGPRTMPNVEETPWPGPTLLKTSASPGASTSTTEAGPADGPTPSPEDCPWCRGFRLDTPYLGGPHWPACPHSTLPPPPSPEKYRCCEACGLVAPEGVHYSWCAELKRNRDAAP